MSAKLKPEQLTRDYHDPLKNLWYVSVGENGYLHRDLEVRISTISNFTFSITPNYQYIDKYTGYFLTEKQALEAIKDYENKIRTNT